MGLNYQHRDPLEGLLQLRKCKSTYHSWLLMRWRGGGGLNYQHRDPLEGLLQLRKFKSTYHSWLLMRWGGGWTINIEILWKDYCNYEDVSQPIIVDYWWAGGGLNYQHRDPLEGLLQLRKFKSTYHSWLLMRWGGGWTINIEILWKDYCNYEDVSQPIIVDYWWGGGGVELST